jgi:hypothetical protein
LNKLRTSGGGPPYVKVGAAVRYEVQALEAWIATRVRSSTSDGRASANKRTEDERRTQEVEWQIRQVERRAKISRTMRENRRARLEAKAKTVP